MGVSVSKRRSHSVGPTEHPSGKLQKRLPPRAARRVNSFMPQTQKQQQREKSTGEVLPPRTASCTAGAVASGAAPGTAVVAPVSAPQRVHEPTPAAVPKGPVAPSPSSTPSSQNAPVVIRRPVKHTQASGKQKSPRVATTAPPPQPSLPPSPISPPKEVEEPDKLSGEGPYGDFVLDVKESEARWGRLVPTADFSASSSSKSTSLAFSLSASASLVVATRVVTPPPMATHTGTGGAYGLVAYEVQHPNSLTCYSVPQLVPLAAKPCEETDTNGSMTTPLHGKKSKKRAGRCRQEGAPRFVTYDGWGNLMLYTRPDDFDAPQLSLSESRRSNMTSQQRSEWSGAEQSLESVTFMSQFSKGSPHQRATNADSVLDHPCTLESSTMADDTLGDDASNSRLTHRGFPTAMPTPATYSHMPSPQHGAVPQADADVITIPEFESVSSGSYEYSGSSDDDNTVSGERPPRQRMPTESYQSDDDGVSGEHVTRASKSTGRGAETLSRRSGTDARTLRDADAASGPVLRTPLRANGVTKVGVNSELIKLVIGDGFTQRSDDVSAQLLHKLHQPVPPLSVVAKPIPHSPMRRGANSKATTAPSGTSPRPDIPPLPLPILSSNPAAESYRSPRVVKAEGKPSQPLAAPKPSARSTSISGSNSSEKRNAAPLSGRQAGSRDGTSASPAASQPRQGGSMASDPSRGLSDQFSRPERLPPAFEVDTTIRGFADYRTNVVSEYPTMININASERSSLLSHRSYEPSLIMRSLDGADRDFSLQLETMYGRSSLPSGRGSRSSSKAGFENGEYVISPRRSGPQRANRSRESSVERGRKENSNRAERAPPPTTPGLAGEGPQRAPASGPQASAKAESSPPPSLPALVTQKQRVRDPSPRVSLPNHEPGEREGNSGQRGAGGDRYLGGPSRMMGVGGLVSTGPGSRGSSATPLPPGMTRSHMLPQRRRTPGSFDGSGTTQVHPTSR